jgi:hypothetical protein
MKMTNEYFSLCFFFKTNQMIFFDIRNLEKSRLNRVSVHNIQLYLCRQVENTKWILCSRKIGVKYLRFQMYRYSCRTMYSTH